MRFVRRSVLAPATLNGRPSRRPRGRAAQATSARLASRRPRPPPRLEAPSVRMAPLGGRGIVAVKTEAPDNEIGRSNESGRDGAATPTGGGDSAEAGDDAMMEVAVPVPGV